MAEKKKGDKVKLTERQQRIVNVIQDAMVLRGYPPSIREIGDAVGLNSTSSVAYQLKELEKKGVLRRDPHKPRAVDMRDMRERMAAESGKPGPKSSRDLARTPEVPEGMAAPTYVPVVGQIAAGNPILAEQNIDEHMALPAELTESGDLYMLRVVGDSMVDAGIFNGDWVVVKSQQSATNGDFVAAMIEGDGESEATVKEWHEDRAGKWLLPHNDSFDPIPVDGRVTILGRVISVLRRL
ncbi:transcriptional repressor LexA [uncultured Corynebacterium sp.]|uniref:transcriptional repressor LexA n=1 Tax=uncultured Corynebacterium sp. TaxID=159447 RepID=UPI0025F854CC|nr:transcriptional repressor LexA [uncultured Corynebacterium sp.]